MIRELAEVPKEMQRPDFSSEVTDLTYHVNLWEMHLVLKPPAQEQQKFACWWARPQRLLKNLPHTKKILRFVIMQPGKIPVEVDPLVIHIKLLADGTMASVEPRHVNQHG